MELELSTRWVVLKLDVRRDGIWIGYEDDLHVRRPVPSARGASSARALDWTRVGGKWLSRAPATVNPIVHLPSDLVSLLTQRATLPHQGGPYGTGPIPLAVFLDVPDQLGAFQWEQVIEDGLSTSGVDVNRIQLVRLTRGRRRPPFELPLRLLGIGPTSEGAVAAVRAKSWYKNENAVQSHGITCLTASLADAASAVRRPPGHDVVLCDAVAALHVLSTANRIPRDLRPRLIVLLGPATRRKALSLAALLPTPVGSSVVWLPQSAGDLGAAFVLELVLGIIHDYSVHEAVKAATRRTKRHGTNAPILFAARESLNDLRMMHAMAAVVDHAVRLEELDPGNITQFVKRAKKQAARGAVYTVISSPLIATLRHAATLAGPLRTAIDIATGLQPSFFRESSGLTPMANARANLVDAERNEAQLRGALSKLAADEAALTVLGEIQERRVDAVLLRTDPTDSDGFFVAPRQTLRAGNRYVLRVAIGRRSNHSVVVGDIPPVDPLLPPPPDEQGYTLHVAVFPTGFRVDSPAMQRITLPPYGASTPAYFQLTAPATPGHARLRIAIFYDLPRGADPEKSSEEEYRNHLIQSFLFHARVEAYETWTSDSPPSTRMELEFSRTERFRNLDSLSPRAIAIGFNENGDTHSIEIKRGKTVGSVDITEAVMSKALEDVRKKLEDATWNDAGSGPRFREKKVADEQRAAELDTVIPGISRAGWKLYDMIWSNLDEPAQVKLGELADSTDRIIQITRFNQNYIFPWALVYDFALPPAIDGQPEAPVCHGFTRQDPEGKTYSCARCLNECLHPDKKEAFCVYGFWGMRHQVEQLLHTPRQHEEPVRWVRPVRDGAVRPVVGLAGGPAASLGTDLASTLGANFVKPLGDSDNLLNGLWSDAERPAILVILGHYETKDLPAEPKGARITLPGNQWLQPAMITQRIRDEKNRKWTEPHPVVILAACESAAADLASMSTFIGALANARAAAVVGTETTIFERLACRLGIELSQAILDYIPFGEAVLGFRRTLVREFNPLGLVITPYGDADLVREKTPAASDAVASVSSIGAPEVPA